MIRSILLSSLFMVAFGHTALAQSAPAGAQISALLQSNEGCSIITFVPSYSGNIHGLSSPVTIGLEHIDPENCDGGGTITSSKIVAFESINGEIQQLDTSAVNKQVMVEKIMAMKVHGDSIDLKILFFGPNDPQCCARTTMFEHFKFEGSKLVNLN